MAEKMKPSEIAWIGDIPESWDIGRVKDYYALQTGFTPDTSVSEYYDDEKGYLWVSIADINEDKIINETRSKISSLYVREKHPASSPVGSLLYSFKLSVGKVAFLGKEMFTNEAIASFANSSDVCLAFLYYSSMFIEENANRNIYGAKILNQDLIKNAHIVFPPLMEQCTIANFLDVQCAKIDSVIADIEKQIETLQKYKKSLITETVTKGLDKSLPMKDSGFDWIRQIPTFWGVERLGNISSLRNGYVGPTKDILVDEGEPYIQSLHVKNGKIVFGEDFYVTAVWGKHHPKIAKGDILLVQTGEIGQIAMVDEQYDGCNCHALIICSPDVKRVYPSYLLYYLMSSVGNSQLMVYETGTTLKHLNSTKIKNSKVIIPPVEVQKDIADFLDARTKKIDAIIGTKQKQMEIMFSHKKSLIYEYVTGKKRVTEVN